jgi:hypothetical protein
MESSVKSGFESALAIAVNDRELIAMPRYSIAVRREAASSARARRKAETQSTIQQYRHCRSSTSRRWRKAVFMESRRSPGWSMHTRARMESFVEPYVGWNACEYWIHSAWTRWPRNRGKRMEFLVDSSLRASLPYNSFFAPMSTWERMIPPSKRRAMISCATIRD